jgi:hypothetical protein
MITNRELLEIKLYELIAQQSRKTLEQVNNNLKKKGVHSGNGILNKQIPLESLELIMLGVVTTATYDAISENKEIINPINWFTSLEISKIKEYKKELNKTTGYPIVFKEGKKIADDFYSFYVPAQKIKELYDNLLIKYNAETQRNLKIRQTKNGIIETINLNRQSVNEMKECMLRNDFITNNITINILHDGEDDFIFKNGDLIINSGELNILDGFHRSVAMNLALLENPDLNYITGVNITNFDVEKGKRFIVQEDKKNKINQEYIKTITESLENLVVKEINQGSKSDLKGKITHSETLIKNNKALILSSIVADAIKSEFNLKNKRDAMVLSEWLIEGLNEILFITEGKEGLRHYNMFAGYISLLKDLQGQGGWREKLKEQIVNIKESTIEDIVNLKLKSAKRIIKMMKG